MPYKVRLIGDVLEIVVVRLILLTQKTPHIVCGVFLTVFFMMNAF